MYFILGILVGLLLSIIIVSTLTYFRSTVERVVKITETKINTIRPENRGNIYLPDDEGTVARKEIIKKNREQGRDTPISELE